MRRTGARAVFTIAVMLAASASAWADLQSVMAERNLEKRSQLALENADRALKDARDAYDQGAMEQAKTSIAEVGESVDLAARSLKDTGKNPRRSPKWFKRAEIRLRELLKKVEAFDREMNAGDREMLVETTARIHKVHDNLLLGLMEGKKK